MHIVFYSIHFDKNHKQLFIQGRVYNPVKRKNSEGDWQNDTLPVTGVVISAGRLKGNVVTFTGKSFYCAPHWNVFEPIYIGYQFVICSKAIVY
jgi:hypothetical protein